MWWKIGAYAKVRTGSLIDKAGVIEKVEEQEDAQSLVLTLRVPGVKEPVHIEVDESEALAPSRVGENVFVLAGKDSGSLGKVTRVEGEDVTVDLDNGGTTILGPDALVVIDRTKFRSG